MGFWQRDQQPEYTLATLPICPTNQDQLSWFPIEVLRIQRDLVHRWPEAAWGGEQFTHVANKNKADSLAEIEEQISFYQALQVATGGLIL